MNTLRTIAILAIAVGCVPAAVPAETGTETCPYKFDSDMPAATFCVYRGTARGAAGEECATDVVVIWSNAVSQPSASTASKRDVYLGFVASPELVVRAIVDPGQSQRAEIVEYTLGGKEAPLTGQMTLPAVRLGSADTLRMDFREPRHLQPGDCAFASYSGTFLGVMRPPSETATAVDD